MSPKSLLRYVPPAEPVLSLLLIGLLLLSALLYYRAVRIQRFLEPALAISQPRNEFTKSINQAFQKEFGTDPVSGIRIKTGSIYVERSVLFTPHGAVRPDAGPTMDKFSRMFLSLLEDEQTRANVGTIMVNGRFSSFGASSAGIMQREKIQEMAGAVQDELFRAQPDLGRKYSVLFATSAQPMDPHEKTRELIEFRIIASELLHIEMLQRLVKYAQ